MAASPASPTGQQASIREQLRDFPGVFWIANWMEVVERFSYYGLRTVVPVYMVLAWEEGGPQFSHTQKGTIFAVWAMVQSFLPIFTGGFADRYGYKLMIAISTVMKIAGYLVMGYAIEAASLLTGQSVAEVGGAAGGPWTYPVFFAGAMLLAAGTAVFKPGVQGIIATTMPKRSASFGWAVFYQAVNIGGFLGPFLAGYLRILEWRYVFLLCAGAIALNFLALLTFREPARTGEGFGKAGPLQVLRDSFLGLLRPRVLFFTLFFAGFWLMFYQLFDILPNFIDDWVDSRHLVAALESSVGRLGLHVPATQDGDLVQEWMINLNALLISLFAFLVGYLTGKIRSLPAMMLGILVSVLAIWMLGMSMDGWWTLLAIGVFSVGEMTASPTKLRYLASIAPPGKEGLYMGYVNATVGIGWSIGSLVAGSIYDQSGDKVNLALQELAAERDAPALVQMLDEQELLEGYAALEGLDLLAAMERVFHGGLEGPGDVPGTLARIRRALEQHPPTAAAVSRIRDEGLARRLGKELGVPTWEALRLLYREEFDGRDFTLAALRDALGQPAPPAPAVEALRPVLLAAARQQGGEEEAKRWLLARFRRTRMLPLLAELRGMEIRELERWLWDRYEPWRMWGLFALIGLGSMFGLLVYDFFTRRYDRRHGLLKTAVV